MTKEQKDQFAIWILTDCCAALGGLSKKNIIHWDMKPENFMINVKSKDFVFDKSMLNNRQFFDQILKEEL